jgi:uroporphyrinogen-III decarboxylase
VGGIDELHFSDRTPAEVHDAISQTGGLRHIVAPGCVIPSDAPEGNIEAAVRAVRE